MDKIRVTATQAGFYEKVREEGESFEVPPALFSKTWMKKPAGRPPKATKAADNTAEQEKPDPDTSAGEQPAENDGA